MLLFSGNFPLKDSLESRMLMRGCKLGAVAERRLAAYAVELAACTEGKPHRAGLKKPCRILEKYALSALTSSPAHVCDVARAVVEYDCNTKICKSLEMLLADDSVQVTRVKQRLRKTDAGVGPAAGWRDLLINLHFVTGLGSDFTCELQLVHADLFLARAGLGAHRVFAANRLLMELAECGHSQ